MHKQLRAASPISYARAGFPSTLLIHGTADRVGPDATEGSVSPQASVRMHDALERAGVATELHLYAGQQHVFDAQPAFGRQCAAIMKLFLDRYVAAAEAVAAS